MSTHDCMRLARVLAFVQRHDHPEAEIDEDHESIRWIEHGVLVATGEYHTESVEATTLNQARDLLGY